MPLLSVWFKDAIESFHLQMHTDRKDKYIYINEDGRFSKAHRWMEVKTLISLYLWHHKTKGNQLALLNNLELILIGINGIF